LSGTVGHKHVARSVALGRSFHADVFEVGSGPELAILHFGGSGISASTYAARASTVAPAFSPAHERALHAGLTLVHVFVTAPFDVPFARFSEHPEAAECWTRHVRDDLVPLAGGLPMYLVGYSGGIELAIRGPHQLPRVLGVGGLGADIVSADIETSAALNEDRPMLLIYNRNDPVRTTSAEVIEELVESGLATVRVGGGGGHAAADYVAFGGLEGLFRAAATLASRA
jgi:hypothetical protein